MLKPLVLCRIRIFAIGLLISTFGSLLVVWNFFTADDDARYRIVSGSMAETFLGPHFLTPCADCAFPIRSDATRPPRDGSAVCPNCGWSDNPLQPRHLKPGELVQVDRFTKPDRPPDRWDAVVLKERSQNEDQHRFAVKRIVGLPGEVVSIAKGEVYLDGTLAQKPISTWREMAALVHDSSFSPNSDRKLPQRWRNVGNSTAWRRKGAGFVIEPQSSQDQPRWLQYHHLPCTGATVDGAAKAPVRDNYGYNQGVFRTLHDVTDVAVVALAKLGGRGEFSLAITMGNRRRQVSIDGASNSLKWQEDGATLFHSQLVGLKVDGTNRLEFGMCDGRIFFCVNRHLIRILPIRDDEPRLPVALEVGAQRCHVELERLCVYRDVYYLDPVRGDREWSRKRKLRPNEYFVLGDNPPISIDSRHRDKGVMGNDMIGRVRSQSMY